MMFDAPEVTGITPVRESVQRPPRVAIVHYWLVGIAGGEKVVEQILKVYPEADIFTMLHDPEVSRKLVGDRKVVTSFIQKLPKARHYYRKLLPIMPIAVENFDLSAYDLVISSESGPAKGVLPRLGAVHICYCHSPMRYIWDQYQEYKATTGALGRFVMTVTVPFLRLWDRLSSDRVTHFLANSTHVASRIRQYYGREAVVLHPPVSVDDFATGTAQDFYLLTGRHVGYKRVDLAIRACNELGRRLVITGTGPETRKLKAIAGPTIAFEGQVSFARLKELYASCRAFLMPGEEDFGIAPVEAMASGRPVIAYGYGGALDSVVPDVSGVLFAEQTVEGMRQAILDFEAKSDRFDPAAIKAHAQRFSEEHFRSSFRDFVEGALATARGAHQKTG